MHFLIAHGFASSNCSSETELKLRNFLTFLPIRASFVSAQLPRMSNFVGVVAISNELRPKLYVSVQYQVFTLF